ncbi:MAG: hypothetical protein JNK66_06665 [Chitinophagales bacterium]|nr:hypothetical protein [Chitinophagales bacterium]
MPDFFCSGKPNFVAVSYILSHISIALMIAHDVHHEVEQLLQQARQMITEHNRDAVVLINDAYSKAIANLDMRNAAFALLAKANFYSLVLNDSATGISYAQEAGELIADDDDSLMAHYEAALGVVYHLQGNIPEAQKNYQSAITRLEGIEKRTAFDNERLPTLYYNNFVLFSYTEDVFGSIEHLTKAQELYHRAGNTRGEINCLTALANHYHNRLQQHDKAIETITAAYKKAKAYGDAALIGSCCNNAGLYMARLGDFQKSLAYLQEAHECFIQVDNPYLNGSVNHQTGLTYLQMKDFAKALDYFFKAKSIYEASGIKAEHDKLLELIAEASYGLGDYKTAYEYEKQFRELVAQKAKADSLNILAKERSKFEAEIKEREAHLLREKNKEVERYVVKLENSNNELKQFAHVASHDLREPLRMIYSYMGLVKKSLGGNITEQQSEFIGFALDGAKRMEQLIIDLLRLAKADANPKIERVKLANIVDEIALNLDTLLKEKKAVISGMKLPEINADRTQVLQIFQNIIANGVKYNESEKPMVKVRCTYAESSFEISIADNGIGIPEHYREKVFQIFQRLQTQRSYSGSGIGLAICKKIVDSMGGKIMIGDNPTGGTVFKITLPNSILVQ